MEKWLIIYYIWNLVIKKWLDVRIFLKSNNYPYNKFVLGFFRPCICVHLTVEKIWYVKCKDSCWNLTFMKFKVPLISDHQISIFQDSKCIHCFQIYNFLSNRLFCNVFWFCDLINKIVSTCCLFYDLLHSFFFVFFNIAVDMFVTILFMFVYFQTLNQLFIFFGFCFFSDTYRKFGIVVLC